MDNARRSRAGAQLAASSAHSTGVRTAVNVSPTNSAASGSQGDEARGDEQERRRMIKIKTLSDKLSKYTRGSDRRQVLRTLLDPELYPRLHSLMGVTGVDDIAAAEREAASERASLNGVKFLQVRGVNALRNASGGGVRGTPVDSYFLQTLREVCGHLCDMDGVVAADPMALYGGLLLRLCRSASERDALEALTSWTSCRTGELILLPLVRRHHRPGSTCPLADPLELELYVEGGNVHAKVCMKHELGLFRRTDLECGVEGLGETLMPWIGLLELAQRERLAMGNRQHGQSHQKKQTKGAVDNLAMSATRELTNIQYAALSLKRFSVGHKHFLKPWVYVDAEVVERINFGTGSSVRILHVSVPEDKNSGYVKK